jgi:tRNA A-37 threonylcarbamoyl transferase component Bud32
MRQPIPKVDLRAVRRSFTRTLWHDSALPADIAEAIWSGDVDRLLFASSPLQIKDRCIAARYDHATGPLLIKQHIWGGAGRTLRSVGRKTSAWSCARFGLQLHSLGIRTPLPRAYFEQRLGPWGLRSYLVTDYVEGTSLYRFIRFGSHSTNDLQYVARQVAAVWQQMVDAGISHNDLKPENFIVDAKLGVWLIDLEKVRLNESRERQRNRCVFDVKNFLHMRSWHRQAAAREIFRAEFLRTPNADWLHGLSETDIADPSLTVVLAIGEPPDLSSIWRAIDSVRDIADEVQLVRAADDGGIELVERLVLCEAEAQAANCVSGLRIAGSRPEWTLLLQQNEVVTPFLAKELQQRIAEPGPQLAIRVPIEPQYFGRTVLPPKGDAGRPLRVVRSGGCDWSLVEGAFAVDALTKQVGGLTGTIQQSVCASIAKYVERLNAQTTQSAEERWERHERPSLTRALLRSGFGAFTQMVGRDGIRSGRSGFQRALLDAVFLFVEEAKLQQLSSNFTTVDEEAIDDEADAMTLRLPTSTKDAPSIRRAA